ALGIERNKASTIPMTQPMREVPYPARAGCGTFLSPDNQAPPSPLAAGRKGYVLSSARTPLNSPFNGRGRHLFGLSSKGRTKKQGRGGGHFSLLHGGFPFPAASIILDAGRIFR